MKKFAILFFVLLILITYNTAFAGKKQPKLKPPKAKSTFTTSIPTSYSQGAVRATTDDPKLKEELESSASQKYLTPNGTKIFLANPTFEWENPNCSLDQSCTITISDQNTEADIYNIDKVISNNFTLDFSKYPLESDKYYLFTVYSNNDADKINIPLCFYNISTKERADLTSKLNSIESEQFDNIYYKDISLLNFYLENTLWFDLTNKLNEMIFKYPDETDLLDYKKAIYKE